MTRPSDITRERILKAAQSLFADRGYKDTSVRAIAAKAQVHQAAINYHFGSKDGLYREVLRASVGALIEHQLTHLEEIKGMPPENALAEFIKNQNGVQAMPSSLSEQVRECHRHAELCAWRASV